MLESPAPLLHRLPRKTLPTTYTGRLRYCDSARTAPPPRSGPCDSQRLATKREWTMRSWPPRSKIAPPPPPSKSCPLELPCANVRFCTTRRGEDWSWQCEVVHVCFGSQGSRCRIRCRPPP